MNQQGRDFKVKEYDVYYAANYAETNNPVFVGTFIAGCDYDARCLARDMLNSSDDVFHYFVKPRSERR
jgi:hypothetical protein